MMQPKTLICAVAATAALVGCAPGTIDSGGGVGTLNTVVCSGNPCPDIQVWVDESTGTPVVKADITTLAMDTRAKSVTLHWKLINSPKYEFRHDDPTKFFDPIIFKGANAGNAPNQFPMGSWRIPSPRDINATNANTDKLVYDYTIRVYVKVTVANPHPNPAFYELDPRIINDL